MTSQHRSGFMTTEVQRQAPELSIDPILGRILDDARWTPSGDNTQPWQFELLRDDKLRVHLNDLDLSVYEYRRGEPVRLAGGMLMESLRIAASAQGRTISWQFEGSDCPTRIIVDFAQDPVIETDPLYDYLSRRSVNRWPYKDRPLSPTERVALEGTLDSDLSVSWFSSAEKRAEFANLSAQATAIRLSSPEAFTVHQNIIDWKLKLSPSKIPACALGLDRPTLVGMRWGMRSWRRTRLMNALGGLRMAAWQFDHKPINASSAIFAMTLSQPPQSLTERSRAVFKTGMSIQRFWLKATSLGLAIQPALATLIFADYGEKREHFTSDVGALRDAQKLATNFRKFFGQGTGDFVFLGRIGEARVSQPDCRSVRRSLKELIF